MTIRLALAALLLLAPASARAQQMSIYDWSAAINLGFGVLNQMMGLQRQLQGNGYGMPYGGQGYGMPYGGQGYGMPYGGQGYGMPYGGQGFGMSGPPGWHLRGQQGWGQQCQPQLMQNPMGQRAFVDPCTGQVVQWVR
jgi:hypothetical protein